MNQKFTYLWGCLALIGCISKASAEAQRDPNSSMTADECSRRAIAVHTAAGARDPAFAATVSPSINGNGGVYLIGTTADPSQEICIHNLRQETNHFDFPAASATITYPRDGIAKFYTLPNSAMRVKQEIIVPGQGGTRQNSPAPPWSLGQEVVIDLPQYSEKLNGQTVYLLDQEGHLGIRFWASLTEGGLNAVRNNPNRFVNDGHKFGGDGNIKGSYRGQLNTKALNENFNLDAELVMLKMPTSGRSINIPGQKVGKVYIHSANYKKISGKIDFDITISPINVTFVPQSCSTGLDKEVNVKLDKIGLGHFANGRNEVYGGTTTLNFRCDPGVAVNSFVTFTDNSNINNTSDVLGLAKGSTAKNVGLKVYLNDSTNAVKFGPVVHAPGTAGTASPAIVKQDYMHAVGTSVQNQNRQVIPLKLVAKYVKTGNQPIVPGEVKGEMMFTFSYY